MTTENLNRKARLSITDVECDVIDVTTPADMYRRVEPGRFTYWATDGAVTLSFQSYAQHRPGSVVDVEFTVTDPS